MDAMRCKQCGDVRWSFTGLRGREQKTCELCGGETVPERRQPHRGPSTLGDERRTAAITPNHADHSARPAAT
jgi:hypothetical protein